MRGPAAVQRVAEDVVEFGLRVVRRFVAIEGTQQATVLAAQAFTSLIPFLVVASALAPSDSDSLGDRLVERLDLHGATADSMRALFASSGDTESAVTWFSCAILIISTLSFTRALQRLYERCYEVRAPRVPAFGRGLVWLGCFLAWAAFSSLLHAWLDDAGGPLLAIGLAVLTGFALWLWTPKLLLGVLGWRDLMVGAAVSGVVGAFVSVASEIFAPLIVGWSAEKYGLIGVAFALQTWLLALAVVIVSGAIIGATAVEARDDVADPLGRGAATEIRDDQRHDRDEVDLADQHLSHGERA